MAVTTHTYNREFTALLTELLMRTVAVSVSGAVLLVATVVLLLASLP